MIFGKVAVAVLKVVACTAGFAIAVSLLLSMNMHHNLEEYFVWVAGGAVFGLCVGISWAIERRGIRIAFVLPTLAGLLVCLVMVAGSRPDFISDQMYRPYAWFPWHMKVLLLGLLIGSVWALSRAGVFKTKQDRETAPTNTGVDVIDQIRKLAELKSEEILTDGEFESKKQELLARL
jgi:hypothetical protein